MSPRILTDKAVEMLADMTPFMREDPFVQAVVAAQAAEYERLDDAARTMLGALFPAQADDVLLIGTWPAPLLSMWEDLLLLPVAPAGVTLADRRAKVLAHIQGRNSAAGSDWIATLSRALGTDAWTHLEGPGDYQVTITVPSAAGSYSAGQIGQIARKITPAHLDIIVGYGSGFLVGISQIGIEPL